MHILVLGPDGPGRAKLEETLSRLGHLVTASSSDGVDHRPREGDVVMLDLRESDQGWRRLSRALRDDRRPLVIVAEQPRRLVWALSGRSAGMMVLTGAESEGSYRVALSLCGALAERQRERSGEGMMLAACAATL